ncbi:MAG TPA: PIN domain-containing protein [Dehalococcoidia bacterium]
MTRFGIRADDPRVRHCSRQKVILYAILELPIAARFEPFLLGKLAVVSFQTVAELRLLALRRGWGDRRTTEIDLRLERATVAPATDQIVRRWAALMYEQMRVGSRVEVGDAWVAATALVYGCPVLTNDRKDFERIAGLRLLP